MRVRVLLISLLVAGTPALAQEVDCRSQARTVERELLLNQQLSTSDRYLAERRLSYGTGLCQTDPNRGAWEIDQLRRDNDQLAQQPRAMEPGQRPWVIPGNSETSPYTVPSQDRWTPGLNDFD